MIFVLLTFLTAFLIEGLGTAVSVIGLSTLFGANPIIIALAIALDMGKLVVVSLLYTYWAKLNKLMKGYALVAGAVTMIITSAGAAGYLSGEFQKAIIGTQEGSLKVDVLKSQQAKYEERKKQIDEQIAKLPEKTTVNQRLRLMNGFKAEQKDLQDKIAAIDKELPELQIHQISTEAKAGPILYISKAFNVPVEVAVKYVILMIIFVFDPLAVFLIVAGNFLLHQRKLHKETSVADADLFSGPLKTVENVDTSGEGPDSPINKGPTGWPDDVDEPGFGNSAVRFDEQIKAMPVFDLEKLQAAVAPTPEEARAPYVTFPPMPPVFVKPETLPEGDFTEVAEREISAPSEPIFEVLHPTPAPAELAPPEGEDEPDPEPEVEPVIEEDEAPTPMPPYAPPAPPTVREQITLDQLRPLAHASLADVKADDSVVFEENPQAASMRHYTNLK